MADDPRNPQSTPLGRALEQCARLTEALRREQARNVELGDLVMKLERDIEHRGEEWRRGFKRLLRRMLRAVDR